MSLRLGPPRGTSASNSSLNFAESLLHLLGSCKFRRDQPELQTIAVNRERQIAKHPLCVSPLLGFRDDSVRIGIDACEHDGKHGNARGQTNLRLNTILLHRDRCGLQILIQPVRGGRRRRPTEESHQRRPVSFSFRRQLPAVVVRRIAVNGMDVHGWIAAQLLRRVLDDEIRSLNSVVGCDVASRQSTVVGPLHANQVSAMPALISAIRAAAALS